MEARAGTQSTTLEVGTTEALFAALLPGLTSAGFVIQLKATYIGTVLPTVGGVLPH